MGLWSIGFILGALMAIMFVGIGVVLDRFGKDDPKGQCELDNDIRVYVPCRNRNRGGDNTGVERLDAEEVINGLASLRMALSAQEKEYLDYACE